MIKRLAGGILLALLLAAAGCAGEFYGTIGDWEPGDPSRRPPQLRPPASAPLAGAPAAGAQNFGTGGQKQ